MCSWRSGNDLLDLTVTHFPSGWAVTAAVIEG
jgi:hypothetical protein